MAEPLLECPLDWLRGTLAPEDGSPFITAVDSGGTPSTDNDLFWDGDIPWLTPKELGANDANLHVSKTERTITTLGLRSSAAKLLPAGSVLLTKRAPVGLVAVNAVPLATNQGFLNFTCGAALDPIYFAYWLKANKPYLDLVANGSTYPELYKGDLFEFEIAVPDIRSQRKIASILNSIQFVALLGGPLEQLTDNGDRLLRIQDQSRRLLSIRDKLAPLLLSGELAIERVETLVGGVA